ncbi:60S acidic ribosomal protein P1, partial [Leucoagaricus sp. SymC.cos]
QATQELAATYAALILADDGVEITSDKILAITNAAGVELEPIWASLLAKALDGKNVKELLSNIGSGGGAPTAATPAAGGAPAGGAAEAPKEEKEEEKEESDEDMVSLFLFLLSVRPCLWSVCLQGFGLFD